MLSYTITSASDWDGLLSEIDRTVTWSEDVTLLVISALESIRATTAGRFYIEVDGITYVYLIIQPPNTLIHELPLRTIKARPASTHPTIPLGVYWWALGFICGADHPPKLWG
jgi:hypothetical protein